MLYRSRIGGNEAANALVSEAVAVHSATDLAFIGYDASIESEARTPFQRKLTIAAVNGVMTFAVDSYVPKRRRDLLGRRIGPSVVFHYIRQSGDTSSEVRSVAAQKDNPDVYAETFLIDTSDQSLVGALEAVDNPFMATKKNPVSPWAEAGWSDIYSMQEVIAEIRAIGDERLWESRHVRPSQRRA